MFRNIFFRNIFEGRYGIDFFTLFLLILAAFLFGFPYLRVLSILLVVYGLFRAFSRNIPARQRELWAFNGAMVRISAFLRKYLAFIPRFFHRAGRWIATERMKWRQRGEYVFPRCPGCRKTLRLPRGKGMLLVTCPVCGHKFRKRT